MKRFCDILLRWGGITAIAFLLLLYIANKPFYAGSAIGKNYWWRLEFGRLKIERNPVGSTETFYIDGSHGPMHFAPEWKIYGGGHWMINIPLWAPLLLVGIPTSVAWRRWGRNRRSAIASKCRTCGYELAGLAAGQCPECGKISKKR